MESVRFPQHSGHSGNKFVPSLAAVSSWAERRAAFGHYALKADRQDTTTLRTFIHRSGCICSALVLGLSLKSR